MKLSNMINVTDPPAISVIVIYRNSAPFLRNFIDSLNRQTYSNFDLLFIDNASTDGSLELLKEILPSVSLIKNDVNKGYAYAANQGIENTKGDFVFLMNPDMILNETYIENIIKQVSQYKDAGSFGGKLLRFSDLKSKNNIIDSTGIVLFNDIRRPLDRGMQEKDIGQYDETEYVFGINGAAVCYRRTMLNDVKVCGEYFDNDFFAFFEDVDLAWRGVLFGWKSLYVPSAIAYHYRGGSKGESQKKIRIYSSRNRYLIYLKNEPSSTFFKYFPLILTTELLRIFRYLFREPLSFIGFLLFIKQIPLFYKKRLLIQEKKKINTREMEKWYFYENKTIWYYKFLLYK